MSRVTPAKIINKLVNHLNVILQFPRNNEILAKVIFNSCSPAAVSQLLRVLELINDDSFPNPGVIIDMLHHLIASVNPLNNGDTHHIGTALSIRLISGDSQKLLNVKRVQQASLNKAPFAPTVDISSLYSVEAKNYVWYRLELKLPCSGFVVNDTTTMAFLADAAELVKNRIATLVTVEKDVYKVNPQGTVVEIYTIANASKFVAVLDTLDNHCPEIKRLVFCSDCRTMKKRVSNRYAVFCNIFRFYYCHITKLPTDVYSADRFWECTLLARMFMDNDNLSVSTPESFTPLTTVTASNPHTNLKKFSKLLTPITPYSKHVLGQQSDQLEMHSSLSTYTTATTPGYEHKTHQLVSDRDFVLFNDGPMGGGRSFHEVVIKDDELDFD